MADENVWPVLPIDTVSELNRHNTVLVLLRIESGIKHRSTMVAILWWSAFWTTKWIGYGKIKTFSESFLLHLFTKISLSSFICRGVHQLQQGLRMFSSSYVGKQTLNKSGISLFMKYQRRWSEDALSHCIFVSAEFFDTLRNITGRTSQQTKEVSSEWNTARSISFTNSFTNELNVSESLTAPYFYQIDVRCSFTYITSRNAHDDRGTRTISC